MYSVHLWIIHTNCSFLFSFCPLKILSSSAKVTLVDICEPNRTLDVISTDHKEWTNWSRLALLCVKSCGAYFIIYNALGSDFSILTISSSSSPLVEMAKKSGNNAPIPDFYLSMQSPPPLGFVISNEIKKFGEASPNPSRFKIPFSSSSKFSPKLDILLIFTRNYK